MWDVMEPRLWRCVLKRNQVCPDPEIRFRLYPPNIPVEVRPGARLKALGWDPHKENIILVHGFNGTQSKTPMTLIRRAFLSRGTYNVFTVDWSTIGEFPCYLSSLSNTRLVAQCTAQLYAHITFNGASAKRITCVGHSLGAHICGMMNNHLSAKMHKIIGLDPARPLVDQFGDEAFRLTRDDAHLVHVVHTNAGALGEEGQIGHVDFCVNGGRFQPGCRGHRLRRARCSHFQSACYFSEAVMSRRSVIGYPCSSTCPKTSVRFGRRPGSPVPMGTDTPDSASGTYCVSITHGRDCKFD